MTSFRRTDVLLHLLRSEWSCCSVGWRCNGLQWCILQCILWNSKLRTGQVPIHKDTMDCLGFETDVRLLFQQLGRTFYVVYKCQQLYIYIYIFSKCLSCHLFHNFWSRCGLFHAVSKCHFLPPPPPPPAMNHYVIYDELSMDVSAFQMMPIFLFDFRLCFQLLGLFLMLTFCLCKSKIPLRYEGFNVEFRDSDFNSHI